MWERSKRPLSGAVLVGAFVLLASAPALAHEGRKLGDLEMEVGWGTEPAFAGELNSVQLLLVHDGKPVVDLANTLDLEVAFGDRRTPMTLEPFFEGDEGTPGDYRAFFIPTSAGQYTFHFSGTIDGEDVDETFTSGPSTFDDVESPQSVQFPVQEPSNGEIAARIDRMEPRLASAIRGVNTDAHAAAADASSAKTLGLIGLLVGAVGLIVAIVALVMSRRSKVA